MSQSVSDPEPNTTPCCGDKCRHADHGIGLGDEHDDCQARERALLEQVRQLTQRAEAAERMGERATEVKISAEGQTVSFLARAMAAEAERDSYRAEADYERRHREAADADSMESDRRHAAEHYELEHLQADLQTAQRASDLADSEVDRLRTALREIDLICVRNAGPDDGPLCAIRDEVAAVTDGDGNGEALDTQLQLAEATIARMTRERDDGLADRRALAEKSLRGGIDLAEDCARIGDDGRAVNWHTEVRSARIPAVLDALLGVDHG